MLHLCVATALGVVSLLSEPASETVKVFILAGQSNMEGKGFPAPLSWQVSQPKYRERYTRFIHDGDYAGFTDTLRDSLNEDPKSPVYNWSIREDVWVDYHDKHGDLTVGYTPRSDAFGPEFNFGQVMGDRYDEQVLIIKTSWGGKALGRGFLPPSLRDTPEEIKAIATAEEKTVEEIEKTHGEFYDLMVKEVNDALANIATNHPAYEGQGYEIIGFVWFQGFNDQFHPTYHANYESNMAVFINDIRSEWNVPDLPVVIGQMGQNADKDGTYPVDREGFFTPAGNIRKAQADVALRAEFNGTVTCVRTAPLWDMEADAIYNGPGGWQADVDKWRQFGDDRPYHYLGSPWFFAQVGTAFGEAMLDLIES
ncbi:MAG: hypothetical protein IH944_05935 [Armatimonadetes bacterium]|nr:hypothetical protein [Armatimonadota bacterium]